MSSPWSLHNDENVNVSQCVARRQPAHTRVIGHSPAWQLSARTWRVDLGCSCAAITLLAPLARPLESRDGGAHRKRHAKQRLTVKGSALRDVALALAAARARMPIPRKCHHASKPNGGREDDP